MHEQAIRKMIEGAILYAKAHASAYETPIGEDYVLGPPWLAIVGSLRRLLDGEIGSLDGGSTDRVLLDLARSQGFSKNELISEGLD
jgi:hypothetical protein